VNRPLVVISLIGLATVAACSNGTTGSPSPTSSASATTQTDSPSTPPTSASAASDPLARTNPCTLLDPALISKNHLTQSAPGIGASVRYCRWDSPLTVNPQYDIQVGIYDNNGLGDFDHTNFDFTDYPIGRHQGQLVKDLLVHGCDVSIAVTKTSRVDVGVIASNGQLELNCTIAKATAPYVEPRLPVGSG
jgi:hypothetical protein